MTETRRFGSGAREGHDASEFYARFDAPVEVGGEVVRVSGFEAPQLICGRAENVGEVLPAGSVALVVTSPPYFAGKEYEVDGLGPEDWDGYLEMLHAAFTACHEVLEPGGRIAVNVANLGRKPYRSLSAAVISMLEDIGYLIRGEHVWVKSKAQSGSTAWGSFALPTNPVFKDLSERIVVASKGCFGRVGTRKQRREAGLPWKATIDKTDYMSWIYDIWEVRPERASRVGHPAPFPLEIPRRLIHLHTFLDDLVLDPFMGSGTTLVAALEAGRRAVGIDFKPEYLGIAAGRIATAAPPEDIATH